MKQTISPRTTGIVTTAAAALIAVAGNDAAGVPVPFRPRPEDANDPAPMVAKDPAPNDPNPNQPDPAAVADPVNNFLIHKVNELRKELETERQTIREDSKSFMEMLEKERKKKSTLVDEKDVVKLAQYEKKIAQYIPDLDDIDFNYKRNPAMEALREKGIGARRQIAAALKNPDLKFSLEGKRRLEGLLAEIDRRPNQQFDAIKGLGQLGLRASKLGAKFALLISWADQFDQEKFGIKEQITQMKADVAEINGAIEETLPLLITMLADKNNPEFSKEGNLALQKVVIGGIRDIGPNFPKGMTALRDALREELKDKNGDVDKKLDLIRAFASHSNRGSAATPELLAALKDKSAPVRFEATKALGSTGAEDGVVAALCATLKNDPEGVNRAEAADSLRQLGIAANSAAPDLIAATKDNDYVAEAAVKTLGHIGPEKGVIAALDGMLTHQEASIRKTAADALTLHGANAKQALPKLIASLKDGDVSVRLAGTKALGNIGIGEKGVGAALGGAVGDKEKKVRMEALIMLSNSGVAAREAAPALLKACDEKQEADPNIRQWALWALKKAEPDEKMVAGVTKALGDTDTDVVRHAAIALYDYGPKAASAAKGLGAALKANSSFATSTQIVDAMSSIGPEREIVAALGAALNDNDQDLLTKWRILSKLDEFGPKAAEALPDLANAISGRNDPALKRGIANTMKNILPINSKDEKAPPKKKEGPADELSWHKRLNHEDPRINAHAQAQRLESRQARTPTNTSNKRG